MFKIYSYLYILTCTWIESALGSVLMVLEVTGVSVSNKVAAGLLTVRSSACHLDFHLQMHNNCPVVSELHADFHLEMFPWF